MLYRFLLILLFFCLTASLLQAQQNTTAAQQRTQDSLRSAQNRAADSLAAIRSYMSSKNYNDSVDAARKQRMDSMRLARQQYNDSVKLERERIQDSMSVARKIVTDSMQAVLAAQRAERTRQLDSINVIRQRQSDSMAAIRAYKNSDEYKDSVTAIRQTRLDSMRAERMRINDSMTAARKQLQDSLMAVRTKYNDSMRSIMDSTRLVQKQYLDSMKVVRQQRTDSLAKVKDARMVEKTERDKQRERKKGLKLEAKIKKKQEAYTNTKMLKKKWGFLRRAVQNTVTHYNYTFNAENKMKEARENMRRSHLDNFDSAISLYTFDPDKDSMKLKNDMDSIVRTASIGLQLHDPRGKWQDDLYLLAGQAFYYKGDYKNAIASFQTIIATDEQQKRDEAKKEKKKVVTGDFVKEEKDGFAGKIAHTSSKNDALLWLARVYAQQEQFSKAQIILDMLNASKDLPERLKGPLAMNYASMQLQQGDAKAAIPYLATAAQSSELDNFERQRASFLAAQLMQQDAQYDSAMKYYDIAIAQHPKLEMDFAAKINRANAAIASSQIDEGATMKILDRMASDGKYKDYYDQVYYAKARLYAKAKNNELVIENLGKSIGTSTNNRTQRGLSYQELGAVYYGENKYFEAKNAYDSALSFMDKRNKDPYTLAYNRSNALSRIAIPGQRIAQIDSLVALSGLPDREQRAAVRRALRDKLRAATPLTPGPIATSSLPSDWYFSNPVQVQKGELDFKQLWGNRPLKDNWRRSTGSATDINEIATEEDNVLNQAQDEVALLTAIPNTPAAKEKLRGERATALSQLATAYSDASDTVKALSTYKEYVGLYPQGVDAAPIYYQLYLLAIKGNKEDESNKYKNILLADFATSKEAGYINEVGNTKPVIAGMEASEPISTHYDRTYELLQQYDYPAVIARTEQAGTLYPVSIGKFQNKYSLLKAIALAGAGKLEAADTLLTQYIAITPNDSLKQWATTVLALVKKRRLSAPAPAALPFSTPVAANTPFSTLSDTAYYVLLSSGAVDGRVMGVKSGLADYNNLNPASASLRTEILDLDSKSGGVLIRGFKTKADATKYLNEIRSVSSLTREYSRAADLKSVVLSAQNLQLLRSKKNFDEYYRFYQVNER